MLTRDSAALVVVDVQEAFRGYDAFAEAGSPFAPEVAARLRQHIYGSGNSVPPADAYMAFRGRAATVQPLLRKRGLVAPA